MLELVTVFAVYGHKILGLNKGEHQLKLLLVCVTGYVDIVHTVIYDVRALAEQIVYNVVNGFLISRNGRRA